MQQIENNKLQAYNMHCTNYAFQLTENVHMVYSVRQLFLQRARCDYFYGCRLQAT